MASYEQDIKHYAAKIRSCTTMTDLLVVMSSWQSFADSRGLSQEERQTVDEAYIESEARLIAQVKPSLW